MNAAPEESMPEFEEEGAAAPPSIEENIAKVVRITRAEDWMDLGDEPFLTTSGCDKVESHFRIDVSGLRVSSSKSGATDEVGDEIVEYEATARFELRLGNGPRVAEYVGHANTGEKRILNQRLPKVVWEGGAPKVNDRGEAVIEMDARTGRPKTSITRGDALQLASRQAAARCRNGGIRKILSINAIGWEDLAAGGIERAQVERAADGKGGQKKAPPQRQQPQQAPRQQQPAPAPAPMTKEQADAAGKYARVLGGKEAVSAALKTAGASNWGACTEPQARLMLDALAKMCRDRGIDDPVTGEVHAHPAAAEAATTTSPQQAPSQAPPQSSAPPPATAPTSQEPATQPPVPAASQASAKPSPDPLRDLASEDVPF
jgi:hypothetical protein